MRKLLFLFFSFFFVFSVCARPLGLKNCGNSCYFNSTIQCLYNVEPLTNTILGKNVFYGDDNLIARLYQDIVRDFEKLSSKKNPPNGYPYTEKLDNFYEEVSKYFDGIRDSEVFEPRSYERAFMKMLKNLSDSIENMSDAAAQKKLVDIFSKHLVKQKKREDNKKIIDFVEVMLDYLKSYSIDANGGSSSLGKMFKYYCQQFIDSRTVFVSEVQGKSALRRQQDAQAFLAFLFDSLDKNSIVRTFIDTYVSCPQRSYVTRSSGESVDPALDKAPYYFPNIAVEVERQIKKKDFKKDDNAYRSVDLFGVQNLYYKKLYTLLDCLDSYFAKETVEDIEFDALKELFDLYLYEANVSFRDVKSLYGEIQIAVQKKELGDFSHNLFKKKKWSTANIVNFTEALRVFFSRKKIAARKVEKQLKLDYLPEFLTIQLKRFGTGDNYITHKLDHFISIPVNDLILDAGKYTRTQKGNKHYELIGIVMQSGSLNGGHYTALVRSQFPGKDYGKWFFCDDSKIELVGKNLVDNKAYGSWKFRYKKDAYILFYKAVAQEKETPQSSSSDTPKSKQETTQKLPSKESKKTSIGTSKKGTSQSTTTPGTKKTAHKKEPHKAGPLADQTKTSDKKQPKKTKPSPKVKQPQVKKPVLVGFVLKELARDLSVLAGAV